MLSKNRIVMGLGASPATSAYNMLRTRLGRRMKQNNWRVLAVTSLVPSEGKTVTSINLAMSFAAEIDRYSILVDLDLRRPTVSRYLGYSPSPGLDSYFSQESTLSDVLVRYGTSRFYIAGNEKPVHNPSELLASSYTEQLIKELCEFSGNHFVICDVPPALASDKRGLARISRGLPTPSVSAFLRISPKTLGSL